MTVVFQHKIYCVIHMASLKAVGESCKRPFFYYKKNLFSAINLIEVNINLIEVNINLIEVKINPIEVKINQTEVKINPIEVNINPIEDQI